MHGRWRYGRRPAQGLVHGGFVALDEIERAAKAATEVYAPAPKRKDPSRPADEPLPSDSPEVAAWCQGMGTPEANEIYKLRAATAECVNAIARNRGFQRFPGPRDSES